MLQIPLWVYYAMMAAGTAAQYKGAEKADKERAKAMAEERERRTKLTKQNEATADQSKQLFANAKADEASRASQLADQLTAAPTQTTAAPQGQVRLLDPNSPPSATSTVGEPASFANVDKRLADRAKAMGAANAFGSVLGDYSRTLGRNSQDIDMNTTSMRNWANNVLPARLEYANQSGRQWNTTGDILKLVGTIMAPMALAGNGANAAANSTTGVLDQMSGVPKAFAGTDLFGANAMGIGGTAGFGSSFGMNALGAAGGMGIAADPRLQELLAMQRLGQRLSPEELAYIQAQKNVMH